MKGKSDFLEIVKRVKYKSNSKKRKHVIGDKGHSVSLAYGNKVTESNGYTTSMKTNGKLFNELKEWFKKHSIEPEFSFNSIYLNRNVEVKKHKDIFNRNDSYFFYTIDGVDTSGGELLIYDENDENKVDKIVNQNTFVKMNGYTQYHEGKPFEGGDRYSIVFYTNKFIDTTDAIQDYVICIPSYNRAEILNKRTLQTLHNMNINPLKIFVYVSSKTEKDEYEKILDKKKYNKIKIGKLGLVENRQFIMDDYPDDFNILSIDDDIESIDLSFENYNCLDDFIKYGFNKAREEGCYLWGVYPVYNSFFREKQKSFTTDLRYIVGCFYGVINRYKCEDLTPNIAKSSGGNKEDIERTLKYFIKDGKVLRFNKIGFKTKYYGKKGGLGTFKERLKKAEHASLLLKEKYPLFGDVRKRKNGMTEFRLKRLKEVPKEK